MAWDQSFNMLGGDTEVKINFGPQSSRGVQIVAFRVPLHITFLSLFRVKWTVIAQTMGIRIKVYSMNADIWPLSFKDKYMAV